MSPAPKRYGFLRLLPNNESAIRNARIRMGANLAVGCRFFYRQRKGELRTKLVTLGSRNILGKTVTAYGTVENPIFDPADVAQWLDYRKDNISHMLSAVDDDEKVLVEAPTVDSLDGYESKNQGNLRTKRWFLTEFGLYETLMLSKKPQAKRFKTEVKKLLHDLRTGKVQVSYPSLDYLTRRLEAVEAELFAARKIIDFYENSDDVFDFDYVAAAISKYMKPPFGVKHLCQWLEKRGVLTHRAYKNDKPRQEYIDRKWFEPKNHTWRQRGKCRHTQTYWFTARGLNGVIRMAIEEKMLMLPTPAQLIFPVLIGQDGTRRIGSTFNHRGN